MIRKGGRPSPDLDERDLMNLHSAILLAAIALPCSSTCLAASATRVPVTPQSYIARLQAAESTPANLQNLGIARSFVSDYDGAIAAFDEFGRKYARPDSPGDAQKLDGAHPVDAIAAIVEQARGKRVVLLNEAHHVPMNRAFAMRLAAELRKIGYTYLACEAFTVRRPDTVPGAVVRLDDGHFLQDPVFAQFIRSAVADNWTLVSYEFASDPALPVMERMQQRELGQAQNLVGRIFARDKDAKVLVYVGYSHLMKMLPGEEGLVPMGEHLRRLTGLDTLHVEQEQFYAHPEPKDNGDTYNAMQSKFRRDAPYVLKSASGTDLLFKGRTGRIDLQVVFPAYASGAGTRRPAWLESLAQRKPQPIPAALLPASGRRLVLAHHEDDPADAIPADIVLVEAGKPAPSLMLPEGRFRYSVQDE